MKYCGVDFSGSDIILLTVKKEKGSFQCQSINPKKVHIYDPDNPDCLKETIRLLSAYFTENDITKVGIKRRATKGKFAGGAISFKAETLVQLVDNIIIQFFSPPQVAAIIKKKKPVHSGEFLKYQEAALQIALAFGCTDEP